MNCTDKLTQAGTGWLQPVRAHGLFMQVVVLQQ
jgi:hypothetical protein